MSHFKAEVVKGRLELENRSLHQVEVVQDVLVFVVELFLSLRKGLPDLVSVAVPRLLIRLGQR